MRYPFAVSLILLLALAHAAPVARLSEEAEFIYAENELSDASRIGYTDVYVPSDDVLQFVRVNVSSTTNTDLVSKEAWHAVAASPNGQRARLFVNTSEKGTTYTVSASAVPRIGLRLEYESSVGGQDLVPGNNTFHFNLSINASSPLNTTLLLQSRTSGADPMNISSPHASDSDSDGYRDRITWSGELSSTPTLVQFNATLVGGTNFNTSLKYADLDDGYGILANHSKNSTFSGLTIANTFSRGPIRQGVDLELFDVWKARGFIRNTAAGLNYTTHGWSLYEVETMAQVASGTVEQILRPNDLMYTSWYDTQSASKAYYASAFDWEVIWGDSEASGLSTSKTNLPTMYMVDLWTQKSVSLSQSRNTLTADVEDIVRHTGHDSVNLSSISIDSVVPGTTVGGSEISLTISDAKAYVVSAGSATLLSVTPSVTDPYNGGSGSVSVTVTSSNLGRSLKADEDIKLTYKVTGTAGYSALTLRFTGSAQVTTTRGTLYSESFAPSDIITSALGIPTTSGGGTAVEIVAPPSTVEIEKDVVSVETLISLGEGDKAAQDLEDLLEDQARAIDEAKTQAILARELSALEIDELGLSLDEAEVGESLLEEAGEKLELAKEEAQTERRLELTKEALELQKEAQEKLPEVRAVAETSEVRDIDVLSADQALETATTSEAKKAIRGAREKTSLTSESLSFSRSASVYAVTNAERSTKTSYRTKATLVVRPTRDVKGVGIIEVIPKSAAKSADEVKFNLRPDILQADPIVAWTFDELRRDETRIITYVVKGKVTDLLNQSISLASVEKSKVEGVEVEALSIEEEVFQQGDAVVGRPVSWSKIIKLSNTNPLPQKQTFTVIIPTDTVTIEVNEGEIRPEEFFQADRRYIKWAEELSPGEHEYRVLISTPPVVEATRSIDVISSTTQEATIATAITLENLAQEAYLNLQYDFPLQYEKVISIEMTEPLKFRRKGGQITILIPSIGVGERPVVQIQNRETPPLLEVGLNKAKALSESVVELTTIVVASETTASPHLELEISGGPANDLVYADIEPLSTLEAGGRITIQDSIDLASMPPGDYRLSILFRKDTRTIRSKTADFTIGGGPSGIRLLPLLSIAIFIFLTVAGIKYSVSQYGDTMHRMIHGVRELRPQGMMCSTCQKRLNLKDVYRCASCGKTLCDEHRNIYHNQEYCEDCLKHLKASHE